MRVILTILVLAVNLLAQKNTYELKVKHGDFIGNGGGDSSAILMLPEQACVYGPFRVNYPDGSHWEIGVGGYVCMAGHARGRTFILTFGYSSFICDEAGDVFLPFGDKSSPSIREFNNGVR